MRVALYICRYYKSTQMSRSTSSQMRMRIYHRYLGFFLAGIMAVYAISGVVLIFRDSDFLKKEYTINKTIDAQLTATQLPAKLGNKKLKVTKTENGVMYFKEGTYTVASGEAVYTKKELPYILDKMTHFHKAKSGDPLFFLNIIFGFGLLFFVISAFWMFMPGTKIFRKGVLFALAGIALALLLLFV